MIKYEGKNAVREALIGNADLSKIMIANSVNDADIKALITLATQKHIKYQFVPDSALIRESKTSHHQGIIGFGADYKYCTTQDILDVAKNKNKPNFIVILDGISDPHNFGSIIRVCECLGVDGIIIGKNRCCPVNETDIKTRAGAISYMKIACVTNINTEIENLKKDNIWVYSCEIDGVDIRKADLTGNIALVIGSEGFGVSALTKKISDGTIAIPNMGSVNSLNASVATGIVLFQALSQREKI